MKHFAATFIALACMAAAPEVTFRTGARVLTVDVMVEDTVNRTPVENLARTDFRLRIDGRERTISYFGSGGVQRRPLAMLVYLNLAPEGGLRELSRQAASDSFAAALRRLSPEDEVAVYAANDWFVGAGRQMSPLTRNREEAARGMQRAIEGAIAAAGEARGAGSNGKEQSMTTAIDTARQVSLSRPDSQVALVYISDGMNTLDTMETRGRRKLAEVLQQNNIGFSALDVQMMKSYASAAAVLNPVGKIFGFSVTGSSSYLAEQSGGVVVEVPDASALGEALGRVVSSYLTRYSLGYQITEGEYSGGRLHRIEVSLRGDAAKRRRVTSRRGFIGSVPAF